MATLNEQDIVREEMTRLAKHVNAFKECTEDIQAVVVELCRLIVNRDTPPDELELAVDVLRDALFPGSGVDTLESHEIAMRSPAGKAARDEVIAEEVAFSEKLKAIMMPITRFFEDYGEARRTVNIATQAFSTETYNQTLDKGISAMRIARGLRADQENDFEIYSNDSLKSAFTSVAGIVRIGAFVVSFIALLAAGIGIMNIMGNGRRHSRRETLLRSVGSAGRRARPAKCSRHFIGQRGD